MTTSDETVTAKDRAMSLLDHLAELRHRELGLTVRVVDDLVKDKELCREA